jgi:hypothetical protein
MTENVLVDGAALSAEVRDKYMEEKARAFQVHGYAFLARKPL